jgi:hypothetical protein
MKKSTKINTGNEKIRNAAIRQVKTISYHGINIQYLHWKKDE